MHVLKVELSNFRNYQQLSVELRPGKTLITGENGHGKTNLIESLFFLANQSSHRVSTTRDLIRNESSSAVLSTMVWAGGRQLLPGIELNRSEANRFFLNGNRVTKSSEINGIIRAVMFSPEDIEIVRRDPSDRRAFLDQVLVQISPKLATLKTNYERVLKQRNALLKTARSNGIGDASTLEIWDDQLAGFGSQLIFERLRLVASLKPTLAEMYREISGSSDEVSIEVRSSIWGWSEEDDVEGEAIPVDRKSSADIKSDFLMVLAEARQRELDRGITLYGPHRDDLLIRLNGNPARTQASQGEAWSIALGLKLSVAHLYRSLDFTGDPVLLLDDVFSVLDQGRRSRLVAFVADYEQVLVTSATREVAPNLEWDQEITVRNGTVSLAVGLDDAG